jgi:hypothetical protein
VTTEVLQIIVGSTDYLLRTTYCNQLSVVGAEKDCPHKGHPTSLPTVDASQILLMQAIPITLDYADRALNYAEKLEPRQVSI